MSAPAPTSSVPRVVGSSVSNTISVQSALELEIGEVGDVHTILPLGSISLGAFPITPHVTLEPRVQWSWDVDMLAGWDVETSLENDLRTRSM